MQNLLLEREGALAIVTVNRPDKLNALNAATLDDIDGTFTLLRDDAVVQVVFLSGAGDKALVAGADIAELA